MLICFVAVMATMWYITIFVIFFFVNSRFLSFSFVLFFFPVSVIINIIIFSRAHCLSLMSIFSLGFFSPFPYDPHINFYLLHRST